MNTNKQSHQRTHRDSFIDILKVSSIILIIITHDSFFIENNHNPLCTYLLDMAVPIFMLISGLNYASSAQRHCYTLKQSYTFKVMFRRLSRFLFPYTLVFISVAILMVSFKGAHYTAESFLTDYLLGGYGPGSYYTPIMVQFVLFSPLLYFFVYKYRINAIISAFIINLFFEIVLSLGMPWPDYSRTIIRYLFIIAVGMYIYICGNTQENEGHPILKSKIILIALSFIIGVAYLTYARYISSPKIFSRWTTTSMMSAFYIIPIVFVLRHIFSYRLLKINLQMQKRISIISSSTFHIYLTQMTYYYIGLSRFITISLLVRIIISIIICLFCGTMFYFISNYILYHNDHSSTRNNL